MKGKPSWLREAEDDDWVGALKRVRAVCANFINGEDDDKDLDVLDDIISRVELEIAMYGKLD